MRDLSAWRRALPVALILALLVVTEAGLIAQNLGTAPQTNVAVQGQTGAQPEGTWLNLINWVGNVVAPVRRVTSKPLTNPQKLKRALRRCRARHRAGHRKPCEAAARKRFRRGG